MNTVKVKKTTLLEILKKNRAEHRDIFLAAQKNYRALVIAKLDAQLKRAREGEKPHLRQLTAIIEPQDHTKSYERAIGMLELSVEKEVSLTEQDFKRFVQDDWEWSHEWAISNSSYTTSPKFAEHLGEEEE